MKNFLYKLSWFAIYAFVLQILLPVMIDPFNVFHVFNIRDNGVEPNKNYIKMTYILANPSKFDSFMFGSSRVGAIHVDKITGEKVYNMTYSAGVPREHLNNLKTFIANNIIPSKIYIGVDSLSYTSPPESHIEQALRCPYEYLIANKLHFCKLYLDTVMVYESLSIILNHSPSTGFADIFYKYGWFIDYGYESNFNWEQYIPGPVTSGEYDMSGTLNDLREIVRLCNENNIELVMFTNPMYYITYLTSVKYRNYLEFLEGLAQITDFYNFSSLNDITLNNNNYLETSHYKAEIGDMMINVMCNGVEYPELKAQGFGVKVTRDNVKDLITLLESQI